MIRWSGNIRCLLTGDYGYMIVDRSASNIVFVRLSTFPRIFCSMKLNPEPNDVPVGDFVSAISSNTTQISILHAKPFRTVAGAILFIVTYEIPNKSPESIVLVRNTHTMSYQIIQGFPKFHRIQITSTSHTNYRKPHFVFTTRKFLMFEDSRLMTLLSLVVDYTGLTVVALLWFILVLTLEITRQDRVEEASQDCQILPYAEKRTMVLR